MRKVRFVQQTVSDVFRSFAFSSVLLKVHCLILFQSLTVDTDNYKCFAVTFAVEQNVHISASGLQKAKFRMQAMLVKSIWESCTAR